MRNLRSVYRRVLANEDRQPPLSSCDFDSTNNAIVCAYGPAEADDAIELRRWRHPTEESPDTKDELELISSWDAPSPSPDLEHDHILSIHYLSDLLATCLVLEGGDLVVVREDPQRAQEKVEIVGSVDVGILAVAWSPDEELFAIYTKAGTLLYMTREFENVAEIHLSSEDLTLSKHVSVGWGKAETQFKGKGAKALRDPTMPEKVDEGLPSPDEDGKATLSWRGDGAFVSLNSRQDGSRRAIRIYSRDGILDSISEPVDGLESAVSWRPEGNILAGVKRYQKGIEIVFFERNGLRHGGFVLRLDEDEVDRIGHNVALHWNTTSSILAVCLQDRVQLWTMGNYHYYLKQEVHVAQVMKVKTPFSLNWHAENPMAFTITTSQQLERHLLDFSIADSLPVSPCDRGIVGVVDGKTLKLTPFRYANVPPPMSFAEVLLPYNVIDFSISETKDDSSNITIAILTAKSITICMWPFQDNRPGSVVKKGEFCFSDQECHDRDLDVSRLFFQQVTVYAREKRLCILCSDSSGSSVVMIYRLEPDFQNVGLHIEPNPIKSFVRTISLTDSSTQFLSLDNQVRALDSNAQASRRHKIPPFPKPISKCVSIDLQPTIALSNGHHTDSVSPAIESIVFGQTAGGSLYANQRLLVRDCNSFLVTPAHLIFTTTHHLLKFVHLTKINDLDIPPDTPEIDERCRSIERGARLVTVIPSTFALILQMPRGNLETIFPRALVLPGIRDNVEKKKYKKAFLACRNHRVDMNIIHDHDPALFTSNIAIFVDQVRKAEHIDLFLAQLREDDVSQTMYRNTISQRMGEGSLITGHIPTLKAPCDVSKVNRICDVFLATFRDRPLAHVQNVISAHVCKNPPDLEAGLSMIAKLQKKQAEAAQEAVEHICFLSDADRLYEKALGLYDLDLTLLVAQQSQKDPREYLPFLQNLQEMSDLRRRYTVDDHLGRWPKALHTLYEMNVFEEFKSYMIKHNLYELGLEIARYQEGDIKSIMQAYAVYLTSTSFFKEAGIAYEYLYDYAAASEAYRLAHLWQESLASANLLPLSESSISALARTLADSLVELKDHRSAATIHLDYLRDVEQAARLFCKGYLYAEAIRVLSMHAHSDLLESVVDAGLVEGMATITELLADCKGQLNAQLPRLRELRIKKAETPLQYYNEGDANEGLDIPDNVSLAPTDASTAGASLFTRYTDRTQGTAQTGATRRTSKNRRREERKRARGKKGSVYEEEYLVASVGRLIERVNSVGDEVGRLITGLMRRNMRERARAVERSMTEVVKMCKRCIDEVFGPVQELLKTVEGAESLEEGLKEKLATPVVKDFGKLSLLSG